MIYLITNRKLITKGSLSEVAEAAAKGGIGVIILREKDLNFHELLPIALDIKERIKNTNCKLIINSNIEVAREVKAHGIHFSYEYYVKEMPKFHGEIGVSIHSIKEAIEAEKMGASYLLASPIFETQCKPGAEPKGIEFIKAIKEMVKIPVMALGGISLENGKKVMEAGAQGLAVMSAIMAAKDPYEVTCRFKDILKA
ncbi:thiamine phosphate synthase [Clostridium sp. UBA4548]|uniref:thiamine phosphate synthase n=1 Tax=Clostridium sp. UBA4548 TaxID=1946361 RepID=UPI0025C4D4B6|nr:thiamine phosphate synthase [Clostridium sp. UBA4548]